MTTATVFCLRFVSFPFPFDFVFAVDGTVRKWWAHVLPAHTLLAEVFMYAQMAYNNPDNPANKNK